jgi:hypothetical protein
LPGAAGVPGGGVPGGGPDILGQAQGAGGAATSAAGGVPDVASAAQQGAGAAAAGVKVPEGPSKTGAESQVAEVHSQAQVAQDTAKSAAEDKALGAAAATAPGAQVVSAASTVDAAKKTEQGKEIDIDIAKGQVSDAKREASDKLDDGKKDKGGGGVKE